MMALLFAVLALTQSASAFYDANLGRWINRDPIEEEGAINLHAFVSNNPLSSIDLFGLAEVTKMSDGFVIEVGKCEIVRHIGHGNRKGGRDSISQKANLADVRQGLVLSDATRAR